jgi:hypothetical protein
MTRRRLPEEALDRLVDVLLRVAERLRQSQEGGKAAAR